VIVDESSGVSVSVIDLHHHLGPTEAADGSPVFPERLAIMDRFGVDQAVLMPPNALSLAADGRMRAVNEAVAGVVAACPDRFPAGVARVDLAEGRAGALAGLREAVDGLGLRGAAWHHRFQGVFADHPDMPVLLRACAELGVPALIHVVEGSTVEAPWRLGALLAACPDVTVIALDAFSSWDRAGELTQLAERYPNLYCESGAMSAVAGYHVAEYVRRLGPERLLLGTDLFMHGGQSMTYQVPFAVLELNQLPFDLAAKQAIFGGNARRLLRLP
jgi:uncharacterized protein